MIFFKIFGNPEELWEGWREWACHLRIIRLERLIAARKQRAPGSVLYPQGDAIILLEKFDQSTRKTERFFTRYFLQSGNFNWLSNNKSYLSSLSSFSWKELEYLWTIRLAWWAEVLLFPPVWFQLCVRVVRRTNSSVFSLRPYLLRSAENEWLYYVEIASRPAEKRRYRTHETRGYLVSYCPSVRAWPCVFWWHLPRGRLDIPLKLKRRSDRGSLSSLLVRRSMKDRWASTSRGNSSGSFHTETASRKK